MITISTDTQLLSTAAAERFGEVRSEWRRTPERAMPLMTETSHEKTRYRGFGPYPDECCRSPAARWTCRPSPGVSFTVAAGATAAEEPFVGITTDGHVVPICTPPGHRLESGARRESRLGLSRQPGPKQRKAVLSRSTRPSAHVEQRVPHMGPARSSPGESSPGSGPRMAIVETCLSATGFADTGRR